MAGFLLGVNDWRGAGLAKGFYPEGMPEEWRLAYYNTLFDCVWLPYRAWHGAIRVDVEGWLGDTRPAFRFLLEAVDSEDASARIVLTTLSSRTGLHAAVDHPGLLWFQAGVDLRQLAGRLRERSVLSDAPDYLISQDGDLATIDRVRDLLDLLGLGASGLVG